MELKLSNGGVSMIDDNDIHIVEGRKWRANLDGYVVSTTTSKRKTITLFLHRLVAKAEPLQVVDHIDGNVLNNTRENLRICSKAQNGANQRKRRTDTYSIYKGVTKNKLGKWVAQIAHNRKRTFMGPFETEDEAAHAYNKKAIDIHGEFACLNPVGVK